MGICFKSKKLNYLAQIKGRGMIGHGIMKVDFIQNLEHYAIKQLNVEKIPSCCTLVIDEICDVEENKKQSKNSVVFFCGEWNLDSRFDY